MRQLFALVSHVPAVKPQDLYAMKFALEQMAGICADAWDKEAPAVEVMENEQNLPEGCSPVAIVDDTTDLSALAYHTWDAVRKVPVSRAFWAATSGLRSGSDSLCCAISHELHEATADPQCDQWRDMPGRPGIEVALENCDPLQSVWTITINGVDWPVANFVTPNWFKADAEGPFDYVGELSRPGQVGPSGYLILRDETHVWQEDANGDIFDAKKPGAAHPWSRTVARLGDKRAA